MDSTSLLSRFSSLFSPIFILSPSRKPSSPTLTTSGALITLPIRLMPRRGHSGPTRSIPITPPHVGRLGLFIHVVYAPVTVPKRKRFLTALPSNFPFDAHHLVLGDFNIPMGPVMDKVTAYPHNLGRAEFRDWLLRLGVLDAWRSAHPGRREFTGPGRRNRIDYCFVSPSLFDHYLRDVRHVTDVRYGHEDHLHVRFLLH
ncbi:unnamed protein product [Peronospora effusa]|nr:unnamed protein product [Peronospora effusa]